MNGEAKNTHVRGRYRKDRGSNIVVEVKDMKRRKNKPSNKSDTKKGEVHEEKVDRAT